MIINNFGYMLSGLYYFFTVQAKSTQKWYFLVMILDVLDDKQKN